MGSGQPGGGVLNSKHDLTYSGNNGSGLTPDNQGRVCAFCHTPHHAIPPGTLPTGYAPLWSHQVSTMTVTTPYASATMDASTPLDPLTGPSKLCMSCHDGVIAPDQHYGSTNVAPTGLFASNAFPPYPGTAGGRAVLLGGDASTTHPIGIDVNESTATDTDIDPLITTTKTWYKGGVASTKKISDSLYKSAGQNILTCATCHDVHNKNNVLNDATTQWDANHAPTVSPAVNYLVYAPQSGSQLCLSCHIK
jgi:hypothetical protein